jgi:ArsR family transcriptional regulator
MHLITVKPEEVFQALADPTRIRIVRLLVESGEEICLCELVDCLREPQYKLSRHLKTLRQAGLLTAVKDGRWLYHRLVTGTPTMEHLSYLIRSIPDEDALFAGDLARFRDRMCLREDGRCRVGIQSPELAAGTE